MFQGQRDKKNEEEFDAKRSINPAMCEGGGRDLPGAFSTMTGILSLYFSFIFWASFFRASRGCCERLLDWRHCGLFLDNGGGRKRG
jgi:hypothetical protein